MQSSRRCNHKAEFALQPPHERTNVLVSGHSVCVQLQHSPRRSAPESLRRRWRGRRPPDRAGREAEGGGGGERFLAGCQARVPGREATDVALLPLHHHHHQPGRKCAEWAGSPCTCSHGIPERGAAAPTEHLLKSYISTQAFKGKETTAVLMPEHWVAL